MKRGCAICVYAANSGHFFVPCLGSDWMCLYTPKLSNMVVLNREITINPSNFGVPYFPTNPIGMLNSGDGVSPLHWVDCPCYRRCGELVPWFTMCWGLATAAPMCNWFWWAVALNLRTERNERKDIPNVTKCQLCLAGKVSAPKLKAK